jgi:pyridoxamine 5'-phosphate oxidase
MTDADPIQHSGWLTEGAFGDSDEPLRLFAAWLDEATRSEPSDPNAMALATVDSGGVPNARMVLMKGFDAQGFVFYTSMNSQKGQELAGQPLAALSFHWKSLRRQVRIRGPVTRVGDDEADAYFATRPRMAQIGAWASQQSAALESRFALEKAVALTTAKYPVGAVPRPPYWVGYRVVPMLIEFWREMPFRLHERVEFRRAGPDAPWSKTRLYP